MRTGALILAVLMPIAVPAQAPEPTTGYAPVNGLRMYYEIHGSDSGAPLVLLHGSFMTIPNNWTGWIGELAKTRKVIAVEMQGHGRTADIDREFSYENLAGDVAAVQVAILHPGKVRKVVSISAVFRHDGWVQEALDAFPQLTADAFRGSPIETGYRTLSPTPDEFPNFVKRVIAMDLKPYDFGADRLKATRVPFLLIHGDADGVRLDHIAEMFRLKGGEIMGDMRPRPESRLAVLPDTTHVTLMDRRDVIVPIVNDFLDAASQNETTETGRAISSHRCADSPCKEKSGGDIRIH